MPTQYKGDQQGGRNNSGSLTPAAIALGNFTGSKTITLSNTNQVYTVTLTGNTTFTLTPDANATAGDRYILIITQDAIGSRTATWPSNFKKAGGALTLTTTASATDVIEMVYDGSANLNEAARSLAVA
jgi:hypothetical protein